MNIKASNLINARGNDWNNQIVVKYTDDYGYTQYWFTSYGKTIAQVKFCGSNIAKAITEITLDNLYWDYSNTTIRALYTFLRDYARVPDTLLNKATINKALSAYMPDPDSKFVWLRDNLN